MFVEAVMIQQSWEYEFFRLSAWICEEFSEAKTSTVQQLNLNQKVGEKNFKATERNDWHFRTLLFNPLYSLWSDHFVVVRLPLSAVYIG